MDRFTALKLCAQLLKEQNLYGWKVDISTRGRTTLGICDYGKKTIVLYDWMFDHCPEEVEDTVRHEVAHAMAGFRANHGYLWKLCAVKVGAKPQRCADLGVDKLPPHKHETLCTGCNKIISRDYRRRTQRVLMFSVSRCCKARITQRKASVNKEALV